MEGTQPRGVGDTSVPAMSDSRSRVAKLTSPRRRPLPPAPAPRATSQPHPGATAVSQLHLGQDRRRVHGSTSGIVSASVATALVVALLALGPGGVARAGTVQRVAPSIPRSYGTGKDFCASGTNPKSAGGYALGANFNDIYACGPPINDNEGNTNFDVPPFDTSVVGYQCAEMANRWLWHATGHLAYSDGWVFVQAAAAVTKLPDRPPRRDVAASTGRHHEHGHL